MAALGVARQTSSPVNDASPSAVVRRCVSSVRGAPTSSSAPISERRFRRSVSGRARKLFCSNKRMKAHTHQSDLHLDSMLFIFKLTDRSIGLDSLMDASNRYRSRFQTAPKFSDDGDDTLVAAGGPSFDLQTFAEHTLALAPADEGPRRRVPATARRHAATPCWRAACGTASTSSATSSCRSRRAAARRIVPSPSTGCTAHHRMIHGDDICDLDTARRSTPRFGVGSRYSMTDAIVSASAYIGAETVAHALAAARRS